MEAGGSTKGKPLFVRIVSDYSDETTDLTLAVDPRFGETAAGLHARVLAEPIHTGEVYYGDNLEALRRHERGGRQ